MRYFVRRDLLVLSETSKEADCSVLLPSTHYTTNIRKQMASYGGAFMDSKFLKRRLPQGCQVLKFEIIRGSPYG